MIADETLKLFEALVATRPGLKRKGKTMPYTRIGRRVTRAYSFIDEVERLSTDKEQTPMPRFITFFSYTAESAKAMIERPSDRSAAGKALAESLGGTQEAFYWMHGEHDGFLITNMPDGVAAAALSAAVGATGAVEGLETHQIFDHDEQAGIAKQADTARKAYKPPTA